METVQQFPRQRLSLTPRRLLADKTIGIFDVIPWQASLDNIIEDHERSILDIISLVEQMLAARPEQETKGTIKSNLEMLYYQLKRQFVEEERSLLYDEALELCPHLSQNLRVLRLEHACFLRQLEKLLLDTDHSSQGKNDWAQRVGVFAHSMREHENAEAQVLLQVYGYDLDAQD